MQYEIGSRVTLTAQDVGKCLLRVGMSGTVVYISGDIIGVDWDTFIGGHSCNGAARPGHGWKVRDYHVAPEIIVDEDDFVDLSDLI